MDENELVIDETLEVEENGENSEKSPELVELEKKATLAENYKIRAEKAEREKKALEAQVRNQGEKPSLGVEDYIDISASLEGLDQREKEYLASQHKQSGKSLKEIRQDEDFTLWQTAYREKVEKEKLSLKPSGTQSESDRPMSFTERLANASVADKEKLLAEQGLYKSPRPRTDRVDLGRGK